MNNNSTMQSNISNKPNNMNVVPNSMPSAGIPIQQNKNMMTNNQKTNPNMNSIPNMQTKQPNMNAQLNLANSRNIDFTKIPVVDAVNMIIITAVDLGASDIHFDPTDEGITVRIRIDGILRDQFFLPKEIKQNVTTRIKIMAGMNITETRLPQDGGIKDTIKGRELDLRVSSLPTKRGRKNSYKNYGLFHEFKRY